MNVADTLWGFVRRWYIVVPGIILALAAGAGLFSVVQPGYERTATQLLLPGEGTIPPGTTNPYLFLGGLLQASDVVVRVMQSEEVLGAAVAEHPGTEVVVRRDPTVSGPVIQIVVTAKSDAAADEVLTALVDDTVQVVDRLQTQQGVSLDDRMTVSLLTKDTQSVLQQKTRILLTAGAVLGIFILTLVVASVVDGLSRRSHRSGRSGRRAALGRDASAVEADADAADIADPAGQIDESRESRAATEPEHRLDEKVVGTDDSHDAVGVDTADDDGLDDESPDDEAHGIDPDDGSADDGSADRDGSPVLAGSRHRRPSRR
jgi:hypothetical protein